jgi:hypothetical protein
VKDNKNIGFGSQRKNPNILCIGIKNNKIKKPLDDNIKKDPNITKYQFKKSFSFVTYRS